MDITLSNSVRGADRTVQGIACGVGAGALWGLVFLAPALVYSFTPLELAIGRYLAYGALAAILVMPRWGGAIPLLTGRDWLSLVCLSLAGNTLYYILLATAVQRGGIAMTSLIIGFLPVTVTVIGSRDRGAIPLRKLAPSLMLCVGGVFCISWQALTGGTSTSQGTSLIALLCAVGALVSWTSFAIGNSRCLVRLNHVSAHDWNLLNGLVTGVQALALIPLAIYWGALRHGAADWGQFAGVSIAVALLASILGNALWNRMSRLLPLTLSGQMILFETLFALLYGFVWTQRMPTASEAVAFLLLIAGVTSCLRAHRRPAAKGNDV
ncbi:DMT family transporter [Sphingobium sp. EM0848]|uniref:DMT family transporter n=1 Tax=Sphingobium sp. EM0848 TaxID=2743473 RepID=UPI00159C1766|nr:DMT family transporter [Sphingobium sp. EM0848]